MKLLIWDEKVDLCNGLKENLFKCLWIMLHSFLSLSLCVHTLRNECTCHKCVCVCVCVLLNSTKCVWSVNNPRSCRLARFYSDAQELLVSDPQFLQLGRLWRELNTMSNFMDTLRSHPEQISGQSSRLLSTCCQPCFQIAWLHIGHLWSSMGKVWFLNVLRLYFIQINLNNTLLQAYAH